MSSGSYDAFIILAVFAKSKFAFVLIVPERLLNSNGL